MSYKTKKTLMVSNLHVLLINKIIFFTLVTAILVNKKLMLYCISDFVYDKCSIYLPFIVICCLFDLTYFQE